MNSGSGQSAEIPLTAPKNDPSAGMAMSDTPTQSTFTMQPPRQNPPQQAPQWGQPPAGYQQHPGGGF